MLNMRRNSLPFPKQEATMRWAPSSPSPREPRCPCVPARPPAWQPAARGACVCLVCSHCNLLSSEAISAFRPLSLPPFPGVVQLEKNSNQANKAILQSLSSPPRFIEDQSVPRQTSERGPCLASYEPYQPSLEAIFDFVM